MYAIEKRNSKWKKFLTTKTNVIFLCFDITNRQIKKKKSKQIFEKELRKCCKVIKESLNTRIVSLNV